MSTNTSKTTQLPQDASQAYAVYELAMEVVEKMPDGEAKERCRESCVQAFIKLGLGGNAQPMDALEHMLQSKDRRTLYPGSVELDLSRSKERLFDEAYAKPGFTDAVQKEFFNKAQSGQLDPFLVVLVGMTLCVGGKYAADDMTKRVYRLVTLLLREPASTQAARYNFFKFAEQPEEVQLAMSKAVPLLPYPLFPYDTLTEAKNSEMLHRAMELEGGGTDAKTQSKFRTFYSFPEKTVWGGGYSVPVHGADGQQIGVADLSDVEAQFVNLQQQVQNLSEKHTRELSRVLSRRVSHFEQRAPKRNTKQNTYRQDNYRQDSYRQDRRGNGSRVYRGGNSAEDEDLLDELFPPTAPTSKNEAAPTRPLPGPQ